MFNEFIGNKRAIDLVKTQVMAAKKLNKKLPNMLFAGRAGIGKTYLSGLIAKETNAEFLSVNATAFSTVDSVVSTIHNLIYKYNNSNADRIILMIDEAHALPSRIEDLLLTIISESKVPIKEDGAIVEYEIKNNITGENDFFSFILATNRASELSSAVRSRLIPVTFVDYNVDEKAQIAIECLTKMNLFAVPKAVYAIAERSWSAREVKLNCEQIYGFCAANNISRITEAGAIGYFNLIGIDENGLNETDRKYIQAIEGCKGKASLSTIASLLGTTTKEIIEIIEPKMLSLGLIRISSSGRELVKTTTNPFEVTRSA